MCKHNGLLHVHRLRIGPARLRYSPVKSSCPTSRTDIKYTKLRNCWEAVQWVPPPAKQNNDGGYIEIAPIASVELFDLAQPRLQRSSVAFSRPASLDVSSVHIFTVYEGFSWGHTSRVIIQPTRSSATGAPVHFNSLAKLKNSVPMSPSSLWGPRYLFPQFLFLGSPRLRDVGHGSC